MYYTCRNKCDFLTKTENPETKKSYKLVAKDNRQNQKTYNRF